MVIDSGVQDASPRDPDLLTTFSGTGGSLVAYNGFLYFTNDGQVLACSGTQGCEAPTAIFRNGVAPRAMALAGNELVWADGPAGKVSWCSVSGLTECATTFSFEHQDAVGALAMSSDLRNLFFAASPAPGETEIRSITASGNDGRVTARAVIPMRDPEIALANMERQTFVMVGGVPWSVVERLDGGPPMVQPMGGDELASVRGAPGIVGVPVASQDAVRALWIRNGADRGAVWGSPCPTDRPCDGAHAVVFADGGEEITTLARVNGAVLWATYTHELGEILGCRIADVGTTCASPFVVATAIHGRVTALSLDVAANAVGVARALYYVTTYVTTAGTEHSVRRAQLNL